MMKYHTLLRCVQKLTLKGSDLMNDTKLKYI